MKDKEYLESKGWKLLKRKPTGDGGYWHVWDHPDHQHDTHGFFQQSEAIEHQKKVDKYKTCDCIKRQ